MVSQNRLEHAKAKAKEVQRPIKLMYQLFNVEKDKSSNKDGRTVELLAH